MSDQFSWTGKGKGTVAPCSWAAKALSLSLAQEIGAHVEFRLQSGTSGMSGLPLTQDFLGQRWGVHGRVFGGSRNSATGWANSIFLVAFREMDDGFDKLRVSQ